MGIKKGNVDARTLNPEDLALVVAENDSAVNLLFLAEALASMSKEAKNLYEVQLQQFSFAFKALAELKAEQLQALEIERRKAELDEELQRIIKDLEK